MYAERHIVDVVTDGAGAATAFTPAITGRVFAIHYIKPGSGGFDNGVDFDVTAEATGEILWDEDNVNASKSVYPRAGTHDTVGVARLYAAGGTAVADAIVVVRDRMKIVIASGGAVKNGQFQIIIG